MKNIEWVLVLRDCDTHVIVEQSDSVIHETEDQSIQDLIEQFNNIMGIVEGDDATDELDGILQ